MQIVIRTERLEFNFDRCVVSLRIGKREFWWSREFWWTRDWWARRHG